MFRAIKNSGEVLNKLKSRGFRATCLSIYDFSTLYTTLPHNLIKEKLINLIGWTFKRGGSVTKDRLSSLLETQNDINSGRVKRCVFWIIFGIPMGTNCAPLVADLFLFCYESDFMTSLSDVKQADIIEAFKSTSRYLDDLLNIDSSYFEGMVNRIYPPDSSDNEAPFL